MAQTVNVDPNKQIIGAGNAWRRFNGVIIELHVMIRVVQRVLDVWLIRDIVPYRGLCNLRAYRNCERIAIKHVVDRFHGERNVLSSMADSAVVQVTFMQLFSRLYNLVSTCSLRE